MKNKKFGEKTNLAFMIIAVLFLVAFAYILSYSNKPEITKCGIQNCHGLDVTCGPNAPDICTLDYQLGDKCRQYVNCETLNNQCKLIENAQFNACKSCAEKCSGDFPNDVEKALECESAC